MELSMSKQIKWLKCQGEVWCPLATVNILHAHFDNMFGVYIIWHGGSTPTTVYVGKGFIRDEIQSQRNNNSVQQYASLGLYVTWASVIPSEQEGVQAYLSSQLTPKITNQTFAAQPIEVNLPWQNAI